MNDQVNTDNSRSHEEAHEEGIDDGSIDRLHRSHAFFGRAARKCGHDEIAECKKRPGHQPAADEGKPDQNGVDDRHNAEVIIT